MRTYKKILTGLLNSEQLGWISRQYQVLGELLHEYAASTLWFVFII